MILPCRSLTVLHRRLTHAEFAAKHTHTPLLFLTRGPRSNNPLSLPRGVRTKTVKRHSRIIVEKYYSRLTLDFHTNKRVVGEVAIVPSKRMRNKIAGFTTHLMKRIQAGPVRGISLKLQEEERERRLDFVPEVSALDPKVARRRETNARESRARARALPAEDPKGTGEWGEGERERAACGTHVWSSTRYPCRLCVLTLCPPPRATQVWDGVVDSVTKEMVDELGFSEINVSVNDNAR